MGPDGDDGVVGEAPVGQDAVALGDEVGPVLRLRPLGVGHGQPVAGGAEVGVEVEAAVGPDVGVAGGVAALVDGHQPPVAVGGGEVGDPHVVAGGGAEVLGQEQPAAVVGDVDRVVGGRVAPVAEDQLVGLGVGAEAVEADAAVERLLAGRHGAGREAPDVVQTRGVACLWRLTPPLSGGHPPSPGPGQGAVPAAVDRPVDRLAGVDGHDPQRRLLVAGVGEEVGEEAAVGGGEPTVEGDGVVVGQGAGVDQDPPAGEGVVAGGQDGQYRVLLVGVAAHHERPLAPDGRRGHQADRQLPEPAGQGVASREVVEEGTGQLVLGLGPRAGGGVVGVLQPAVGVGHGVAVEVLHNVLPRRGGVPHRRMASGSARAMKRPARRSSVTALP